MKQKQINYVTVIAKDKIKMLVVDKILIKSLKAMGAHKLLLGGRLVEFSLDSDASKIAVLKELMNMDIYFVGGSSGWPPSEILKDLRDKNLVEGKIKEVIWLSPDNIITKMC